MAVNMAFSTIQYGVSRGVAKVVLNRPEQMNAIDATLYDELKAALIEAREDDEVRVVLLTGAGDRAFCAGADLKASGKDRPTDADHMRLRNVYPEKTLNAILVGFAKPVIAAVNGVAAGGGLALALAADIVIASEAARFGTAHAKLGMPVLDMLGYLLPRRIGPGKAAELIFTARIIDAGEALGIGLVDRVVPAVDLLSAAGALAEEIAGMAPLALYFSKQALRRSHSEGHEEYARYERHILNVCMHSEDAKEALRARREKRPPKFTGK